MTHDATGERFRCDACGRQVVGAPSGRGLLIFHRGDEVVREEPPLCEKCALAISLTALHRFVEEEEEG